MPRDANQIAAELAEVQRDPISADFRLFGVSIRAFLAADLRLAVLTELLMSAEWSRQAFAMPYEPLYATVLEELGRRFTEYGGTALTLVEHTRRRIRGREDEAFAEEVGHQVRERFVQNPDAQLVQGLRNYSTHYEILPVRLTVSSNRTETATRLFLDRATLLDSSFEWSAAARDALIAAPPEIDVEALRDRYTRAVVEFHHWLNQRWPEQVRAIVRRQDELRHELRLAQRHAHLASVRAALGMVAAGIGTHEDVMRHLVHPDQIRAVREAGGTMADLLEIVEREYGELPGDLRAALHDALAVDEP